MRCEVCGREIIGPPQRRIIEGAKLTVCNRCAAFGTAEWVPGKPTLTKGSRRQLVQTSTPRPRLRNDVESVEQFELIEDYGAHIRRARQRLGLTERDLAQKMQEKESVIKNLEKEDLTPDYKMIAKIKRYLGVDIVEHAEAGKTPILAKPSGEKTIGDLLKIEDEKEKP